ncbi:MAG: Mrp/NBP35 family ATP-binding protein [Planctomycetota bacterium]
MTTPPPDGALPAGHGEAETVSEAQLLHALRGVEHPELRRDLVTLGRVSSVDFASGKATVAVRLDRLNDPAKGALRQAIDQALRALGPAVQKVEVEFSASLAAAEPASAGKQAAGPASSSGSPSGGGGEPGGEGNPLPHVKHVIAVGAGKGGVGKSTLAVNLAVGLARRGAKVGLLDGDIYGPSIPTMLGTERFEPRANGNILLPFEVHGIRTMSIGALVEDDQALIWRGPMAHGAFRQLATQTDWGELDYLLIDLPPGTGDVPLTMAQLLPLTGAVVVCTPQKVARDDARRAVAMFEQLQVPVLGIVENMSCFVGDDGKTYDLFGKGGAAMLAEQLGLPFLGDIPIHPAIREHGDTGDPTANFTRQPTIGEALQAVCSRLVSQIGVLEMEQAAARPSLTVH